MKPFWALVLFIATITGKLIIDLHLYFHGGTNYHVIGPIIVLLLLSVCSFLAGWQSIFMWFLCFWALFDSLYGLFIGHGLLYVGTTAWLDILQRKYQLLMWFKYIGATGSIIFYFKTKNHGKVIRN